MGAQDDLALLRRRCDRLENRIDALEGDRRYLLEVNGALINFMFEHLRDRHDADLNRDDAPDVEHARAAVRMRNQRQQHRNRDVHGARKEENRTRPPMADGGPAGTSPAPAGTFNTKLTLPAQEAAT